jgi:hypothetical protein
MKILLVRAKMSHADGQTDRPDEFDVRVTVHRRYYVGPHPLSSKHI